MNKIEFRAWDKKHKMMWGFDQLLEAVSYGSPSTLDLILSEQPEWIYDVIHNHDSRFSETYAINYSLSDFVLIQWTRITIN